jgi:hypothetical protein
VWSGPQAGSDDGVGAGMYGSTKSAKPSYQIISSSQRAEAAGHHQFLV